MGRAGGRRLQLAVQGFERSHGAAPVWAVRGLDPRQVARESACDAGPVDVRIPAAGGRAFARGGLEEPRTPQANDAEAEGSDSCAGLIRAPVTGRAVTRFARLVATNFSWGLSRGGSGLRPLASRLDTCTAC